MEAGCVQSMSFKVYLEYVFKFILLVVCFNSYSNMRGTAIFMIPDTGNKMQMLLPANAVTSVEYSLHLTKIIILK